MKNLMLPLNRTDTAIEEVSKLENRSGKIIHIPAQKEKWKR